MITQEKLKTQLHYDSELGLFTWIVVKPGISFGKTAGHKSRNKYVEIRLFRKLYRAHQLAFLYMKGYIPNTIDHIDRNPSNNKWNNLRECTQSNNMCNAAKRKNNKSGHKGIVEEKDGRSKKWRAEITLNYKRKLIGRYYTKEEAAQAYNDAAIKYQGEFSVLNILEKDV